jgi:hypothetical protein
MYVGVNPQLPVLLGWEIRAAVGIKPHIVPPLLATALGQLAPYWYYLVLGPHSTDTDAPS